ncbi:TPA: hypothetical protein ACH3X1_015486 [Trebouxia sp. C0004]
MLKRRRSGPLLPYANIRPAKQPSSTSVALKRLFMTTSVILVLLFSGHALFAVSDVPANKAGHKTAAEAILPEHLQLRERSARGLTETDPSQESNLVAKADAAVSLISNKISHIDCTNGKCASPEDAKGPPTTPFSPPPQTPSMKSPPALLAQQHDMNPVMQQQMQQVHQKEAEQLQQAPLATQQAHPHKQTLQQAHAEAQQHFQQSHQTMESPALPAPVQPSGTGIYAMTVQDIEGNQRSLGEFANKVAVVVNVASQCGFTESNYKGLQFLYDKYKDYDFTVLAFPCNQFGQQESGSDADIKQFVKDRYGITFPMFSKVDVNGPQTSQLFTYLKQSFPPWLGMAASGNTDLSWNFNKFLIGRNGMPIKHYPSELDYAQLEQDVYNELVKTQNS